MPEAWRCSNGLIDSDIESKGEVCVVAGTNEVGVHFSRDRLTLSGHCLSWARSFFYSSFGILIRARLPDSERLAQYPNVNWDIGLGATTIRLSEK